MNNLDHCIVKPVVLASNKVKKGFGYYAFLLLLCTFPLPLYFNIGDGFTVIDLSPVESFTSIGDGGIPVPLGLVSFSILLMMYITSYHYYKKYISFEFVSLRAIYLVGTILFILLLVNLYNHGSFLKLVQLYFFVPFAIVGLRVVDKDFRDDLRVFLLVPLSIVVIAHLISYYFNSEIEFPYRYAAFLNSSIYSSLVSWPTVLSMYMGLIIFWNHGKYSRSLALILVNTFILSILLLDISLSQRRESALLISIFFIIFSLKLITIVPIIILKLRIKRSYLIILFSASILVLYIYYGVFGERLFGVDSEGIIDVERASIWSDVILLIDPVFLLFGQMYANNNMHNYFISVFVSFGILGLMLIIIPLFSSARFYFPALLSRKFRYSSLDFYSGLYLLLLFIISNFVNASATQPYVLLNFVIVLLLINANFNPVKVCNESVIKI